MARTVPLALRLPNPPPVLLGRGAEEERVSELIRRGPLAVVHGPDSIGKLALVLAALHRRFKARTARTLYVRAVADESIEATVVRALALVHELPSVPHDDLAEVAIDLAESAGVWLVIDGVTDPTWTFATLVGRYARTARWIFIGESTPVAEILEHTIAITALGPDVLAQIAASWYPDLDPHEHSLAAAAAHGSPWRLRGVLAERLARGPGTLVETDLRGARSLDQLASVHEPVPVALLELQTAELATLVTRGLVNVEEDHVALHSAARALRAPAAPDVEFATRLATTHEPALVADAIVLALRASRFDLARSWLDADGARVLAAGYAARIGRVLPTQTAELGDWPLWIAVELGDAERLLALPAPVHGTERRVWAEGLYRAGRIDEALAAVRDLAVPSARLLVARILGTDDFEAALKVIETLEAPEAIALGARVAALAGKPEVARQELARLETNTDGSLDFWLAVASAHHELGDLTATDTVLDRIEMRLAHDPLARFTGRRARLLRAAVRIDRGELASAGELLADIERASGSASLHRVFLHLLAAQLALALGEAARARTSLESVPLTLGKRYLGAWRCALEARVSLLDAGPVSALPEGDAALWPRIAHLHVARVALRRGERVEQVDVSTGASFELWIAAQALAWERALVTGDRDHARALALVAATRADDAGFAMWAHEARAFAADLDAPVPTPAELERRARGEGVEARRARYLLGHGDIADALDRAVLAQPSLARIVAGPTLYMPGWGVDSRTRSAWLPDGRCVELADSPQLWRLLQNLVAAPGGLSKEQLVVSTWDETEYHPLHHDKRLHNAIHKLRKLLEDDDARRIPTTPDGYRLGETEPVRVV